MARPGVLPQGLPLVGAEIAEVPGEVRHEMKAARDRRGADQEERHERGEAPIVARRREQAFRQQADEKNARDLREPEGEGEQANAGIAPGRARLEREAALQFGPRR